jgi:hypothetical protein
MRRNWLRLHESLLPPPSDDSLEGTLVTTFVVPENQRPLLARLCGMPLRLVNDLESQVDAAVLQSFFQHSNTLWSTMEVSSRGSLRRRPPAASRSVSPLLSCRAHVLCVRTA